MQTATLSYRYNSKNNFHSDSKSKFQPRHILTTVTNLPKKSKQQRSLPPEQSINSNGALPPIKNNNNNKLPSSIHIKGNGVPSSRSRSRQSDKIDLPGIRSRSITPSRNMKSAARLVQLRFGYPVTIRSSDFYGPDCTESELRFREDSFVNDSIRTAHQRIRPSKIPPYDAFDDPNLKHFFESSVVLNVVRRTLNVDLDARPSDTKKRSRRKHRDESYHKIIAKQSSGYGKLNGYDCLPPSFVNRHSSTHDRYQSAANTSLKSYPTCNSFPAVQKKKSRPNDNSKQLPPTGTSSHVRQPTAATADTGVLSSVSQN